MSRHAANSFAASLSGDRESSSSRDIERRPAVGTSDENGGYKWCVVFAIGGSPIMRYVCTYNDTCQRLPRSIALVEVHADVKPREAELYAN